MSFSLLSCFRNGINCNNSSSFISSNHDVTGTCNSKQYNILKFHTSIWNYSPCFQEHNSFIDKEMLDLVFDTVLLNSGEEFNLTIAKIWKSKYVMLGQTFNFFEDWNFKIGNHNSSFIWLWAKQNVYLSELVFLIY